MKNIPEVAWVALATVGIWIGVGFSVMFSPGKAEEISVCGVACTIIMWIFWRLS